MSKEATPAEAQAKEQLQDSLPVWVAGLLHWLSILWVPPLGHPLDASSTPAVTAACSGCSVPANPPVNLRRTQKVSWKGHPSCASFAGGHNSRRSHMTPTPLGLERGNSHTPPLQDPRFHYRKACLGLYWKLSF